MYFLECIWIRKWLWYKFSVEHSQQRLALRWRLISLAWCSGSTAGCVLPLAPSLDSPSCECPVVLANETLTSVQEWGRVCGGGRGLSVPVWRGAVWTGNGIAALCCVASPFVHLLTSPISSSLPCVLREKLHFRPWTYLLSWFISLLLSLQIQSTRERIRCPPWGSLGLWNLIRPTSQQENVCWMLFKNCQTLQGISSIINQACHRSLGALVSSALWCKCDLKGEIPCQWTGRIYGKCFHTLRSLILSGVIISIWWCVKII